MFSSLDDEFRSARALKREAMRLGLSLMCDCCGRLESNYLTICPSCTRDECGCGGYDTRLVDPETRLSPGLPARQPFGDNLPTETENVAQGTAQEGNLNPVPDPRSSQPNHEWINRDSTLEESERAKARCVIRGSSPIPALGTSPLQVDTLQRYCRYGHFKGEL